MRRSCWKHQSPSAWSITSLLLGSHSSVSTTKLLFNATKGFHVFFFFNALTSLSQAAIQHSPCSLQITKLAPWGKWLALVAGQTKTEQRPESLGSWALSAVSDLGRMSGLSGVSSAGNRGPSSLVYFVLITYLWLSSNDASFPEIRLNLSGQVAAFHPITV